MKSRRTGIMAAAAMMAFGGGYINRPAFSYKSQGPSTIGVNNGFKRNRRAELKLSAKRKR